MGCSKVSKAVTGPWNNKCFKCTEPKEWCDFLFYVENIEINILKKMREINCIS